MPRAVKAVTLRLDPRAFQQLAAIAQAENRSPSNYVATLVLRDLAAKDETRCVISMRIAPELAGVALGEVERVPGELDEEYAQRKELAEALMAIPDDD